MPFDLTTLLSDPNFLQQLGHAGSTLGGPGSVGAALDPSAMIAKQQEQQATKQMLAQILGNATAAQPTSQGGVSNIGEALSGSYKTGENKMLDLIKTLQGGVTPKGSAGLDSHTINKTAEGETHTFKVPSQKQLSTYGTSVPPESQGATSGGASPFYQALLG